tara:strand:- start:355 stop:465 length:111 start_codon:yes stop_codon:yes gene_type:complete
LTPAKETDGRKKVCGTIYGGVERKGVDYNWQVDCLA